MAKRAKKIEYHLVDLHSKEPITTVLLDKNSSLREEIGAIVDGTPFLFFNRGKKWVNGKNLIFVDY